MNVEKCFVIVVSRPGSISDVIHPMLVMSFVVVRLPCGLWHVWYVFIEMLIMCDDAPRNCYIIIFSMHESECVCVYKCTVSLKNACALVIRRKKGILEMLFWIGIYGNTDFNNCPDSKKIVHTNSSGYPPTRIFVWVIKMNINCWLYLK